MSSNNLSLIENLYMKFLFYLKLNLYICKLHIAYYKSQNLIIQKIYKILKIKNNLFKY